MSKRTMDYIDIPSCALLRHGTVIVRLRMEVQVTCGCSQPTLRGDHPEVVHRLTKCEQCSRTRTISQYSDCDNDSGLVDRKCRPYRRNAARSRYVNVCAAACLILLAGGLCRSSAAPARDRSVLMDDKDQGPENPIWANVCDTTVELNRPKYTSTLPESLESVTTRVLNMMNGTMKDEYASKFAGEETFEKALSEWKDYDWMVKFMKLQPKEFREKALFPEKQLGRPLRSFRDMQPIMLDIDNLLPYMFKASKMIIAGMVHLKETISTEREDPLVNDNFKERYINFIVEVRAFSCALYEVVSARRLPVLPLFDDEIPDFSDAEEKGNIFLLFRDTMWFLEYIKQVAQTMKTSVLVPKVPSE